jgi:hypothetical protein
MGSGNYLRVWPDAQGGGVGTGRGVDLGERASPRGEVGGDPNGDALAVSGLHREAGEREGSMKRVFISGPYTADTEYEVLQNIAAARDASVAVREMGHGNAAVFCPHCNSAHLGGTMPYDFWIRECLAFLETCDAIVMLPGWERSPGAKQELAFAAANGIARFELGEDDESLAEFLALTGPYRLSVPRSGQTRPT